MNDSIQRLFEAISELELPKFNKSHVLAIESIDLQFPCELQEIESLLNECPTSIENASHFEAVKQFREILNIQKRLVMSASIYKWATPKPPVEPILADIQRILMELPTIIDRCREYLSDSEQDKSPAIPLTPNDRDILLAMLEMNANIDRPVIAEEIIRAALGKGDHKKAFKRLKANKYVEAKGGTGGGNWLTKLGFDVASKLH